MAVADEWLLVVGPARARLMPGLPPRGARASAAAPPREISADSDAPADRASRRAFVRRALALAEAGRRAGDFGRLAIVADGDLLELLRAEMPPALGPLVTRALPREAAGPDGAGLDGASRG